MNLVVVAGSFLDAYHWAGERGLKTREWMYPHTSFPNLSGREGLPYVVIPGAARRIDLPELLAYLEAHGFGRMEDKS